MASLVTRPAPPRERMLRATAPIATRLVRRDFRINDATAARARVEVVAAMDRLEAELQPTGYLVGDGFTRGPDRGGAPHPVAGTPQRPYAPATLARPLLELREELSARPGGRWVAEMYARHRGESAELGTPGTGRGAPPPRQGRPSAGRDRPRATIG